MLPPGVPRPRLRVGLSRNPTNAPKNTSVRRTPLTPIVRTIPKPTVRKPSLTSDESTLVSDIQYFAALYTKRSKKKHKSWLDGYVILRKDRAVELQDENGKKISSLRFPKALGGLKEGNTLEIGSFELEIQNSVKSEDYISGRLFLKQTPLINTTSTVNNTSKVNKPRSAFKPLRPKSQQCTESKPAGPLYDPSSPNAFVLLPATRRRRGENTIPVVLDPYLCKKMRPHQKDGVKFLYNCVQGNFYLTGEGGQGAILADEMGLGKSLQAIALIWTLLKQSPKGPPLVKKAIIVCPASLVQNWVTEVNKWLGYERLKPVAVESGNSTFESKQAMAAFINGNVKKLLVVSYEMFRSNADDLYNANCGLVICDEGHRLKSSQGNRTIEALKKLPCKRRVILTGTPVQNDLEEFFAVCDFVNPSCLNSLASFRTVFDNPIFASRDSNASPSAIHLGKARAQELSRITSCFVIRRTSELLKRYLPPKQETAIFCRLQPKQEEEYMKEADSRYVDIASMTRFSAALSAITYLRKICSHPILVNGAKDAEESDAEEIVTTNPGSLKRFDVSDSSKMQLTISLCQVAISVQDRVVVVSNFTSTLDLIQEALKQKNITFCRLDGSTSSNLRSDIVRQFNNGTLGDVFLLSAKAGGVGLNLIGANRLVLFDPDWNPATDLQAMGRVWRDGQKKKVFIYRLLSTGTIEEKIFQRQLFKGELQSALEEQSRNNLDVKSNGKRLPGKQNSKDGNFSAEELRDLFQYDGKISFCDTLQVLERSQMNVDECSLNRGIEQPETLLQQFGAYRDLVKRVGIEGIVLCEDDDVLDHCLNARLETNGIVSYLYTKRSDNAAAEVQPTPEKELTPSKKRKATDSQKDNQFSSIHNQAPRRKVARIIEASDEESSDDSEILKQLEEWSSKRKETRAENPTTETGEKIDESAFATDLDILQTESTDAPDSSVKEPVMDVTSTAKEHIQISEDDADISKRWEEAVDQLVDDEPVSL